MEQQWWEADPLYRYGQRPFIIKFRYRHHRYLLQIEWRSVPSPIPYFFAISTGILESESVIIEIIAGHSLFNKNKQKNARLVMLAYLVRINNHSMMEVIFFHNSGNYFLMWVKIICLI
jgi:hypothetical protein